MRVGEEIRDVRMKGRWVCGDPADHDGGKLRGVMR